MSTLADTISDGVTITKRNLIKVKRVPDLIVFATLSPIMFVLLFVYVFGSAIPIPGISYAVWPTIYRRGWSTDFGPCQWLDPPCWWAEPSRTSGSTSSRSSSCR